MSIFEVSVKTDLPHRLCQVWQTLLRQKPTKINCREKRSVAEILESLTSFPLDSIVHNNRRQRREENTMKNLAFFAEFLATLSCSLFAGAAAYVTFVEHPARMSCGTELAAQEFIPSYRRGTIMQASLSLFGSMCAVAAWLLGGSLWWTIAAIPLALVIPFTLVIISPTNRKLVNPTLDRKSETARQLLSHWGRLHAVRSMLSIVSLVSFLFLLSRAA